MRDPLDAAGRVASPSRSVLEQIAEVWVQQTRRSTAEEIDPLDEDRPVVRAVVDTNVVAYLLLGTEGFAQESRRFIGLPDEGIAPAVCEAEVANVVWAAVRQGVMPLDEGGKRLTAAARLRIRSVSIQSLWHGALFRGVRAGVAVHDAPFVEAVREALAPSDFRPRDSRRLRCVSPPRPCALTRGPCRPFGPTSSTHPPGVGSWAPVFARASAIAADIPRCPEAPPHRPPSRPTREPASGFRRRVTCKQMGAAEFNATCPRVIKQMGEDGEPVTITNRGRPVTVLAPLPPASAARPAGAAPVHGVGVPAITPWEIALLTENARLRLRRDVTLWIDPALRLPRVHLAPMLSGIALDCVRLPGAFHPDPVDRLTVATARHHGAPLLSAEHAILEVRHAATSAPSTPQDDPGRPSWIPPWPHISCSAPRASSRSHAASSACSTHQQLLAPGPPASRWPRPAVL